MNTKFVQADRDQMSLLPYDLRDWIAEDDFVHFVIEASEHIDVTLFKTNERGTGDAQYHPHLMLALLIYCYANGVFGSRRIERATYRDIAVRYICANTHPDHDTICTFRRENRDAFAGAFLYVLKLAREMKLLKVGTISVDGSKIKANASKDKNVRYDRAKELEQQLKIDIDELMKKAEQADVSAANDEQKLPQEIGRRKKLRDKMEQACQTIENQARMQNEAAQREYEKKVNDRDDRQGIYRGVPPKQPQERMVENTQTNLTDSDSRLMRKNCHSEFVQAYNAQISVDADGSQLIVASRVSQCASDRNELVADVHSISPEIGTAACVLADSGYATEDEVVALESSGVDVYVSVHSEDKESCRRYDFRPKDKQKLKEAKNGPATKPWIKRMNEKMASDQGRIKYRLRKQTVEPVFGIVKHAMGFRQFLLRGLEKTELEWLLVSTAYNFRRLFVLATARTAV
jgi:transposase